MLSMPLQVKKRPEGRLPRRRGSTAAHLPHTTGTGYTNEPSRSTHETEGGALGFLSQGSRTKQLPGNIPCNNERAELLGSNGEVRAASAPPACTLGLMRTITPRQSSINEWDEKREASQPYKVSTKQLKLQQCLHVQGCVWWCADSAALQMVGCMQRIHRLFQRKRPTERSSAPQRLLQL
jgi:hypothetical protein